MIRRSVDEDVLRTVRDIGRPARFREIAERLEAYGISKSQTHNAVYRLGKKGRLRRAGSGAAMTYTVVD